MRNTPSSALHAQPKSETQPTVMGVHAAAPVITTQGKWIIATALSAPFAVLAVVEWLVF